MENKKQRAKAVLLVGPTGSGKTPLGQALEEKGIGGRRLFHFDFGENLRAAADDPEQFSFLKAEDVEVIRHSLKTNTLLEDKQFNIVEALFSSFARKRGMGPDDGVVLNGMPRHVGQAEKMADLVDVVRVVYLRCDEDTVVARIVGNSGGDRTDRTDDDLEAIKRKCRTFNERTLPLLSFFEGRVLDLEVAVDTGPFELVEKIRQGMGNIL